MRKLLFNSLKEDWKCVMFVRDEHGKTICLIYTSIDNVSIFNKADWPQLISFFKSRIIALDEFWSSAKNIFEVMR